MTFLPVVEREMRSESRRPFNYWLRVIGAGVLTVVAVLTFLDLSSFNSQRTLGSLFALRGQNPYANLGITLFGSLNAALFLILWVLVPILTADCINREKREGTLGLLFLTPLTPIGIVVGKGVVHSLRALTLLFTMLPILALPLMLGGVTVLDGLMAALINLCSLLLALAAGLLASAWTRDWLKSVALAQLLSVLFALWFMNVHHGTLQAAVANANKKAAPGGQVPGPSSFFRASRPSWVSERFHGGFFSRTIELFALTTNIPVSHPRWTGAAGTIVYQPLTAWSEVWSACPVSVHAEWFRRNGLLLLFCFGALALAVLAAAKSIERGWQEMPPSPKRQRVNAVFTRPVVGRSFLRRKLKRALERNPIGWLQQYSWNARLTKWGWCSFVLLTELLLASNWNDAWDTQFWIALLILLALTFSASASFRRERETGALELLLVTPLRAGQIIRGRLQGIRMQYLPSLAILLLAWFCLLQPSWVKNLWSPENWERDLVAWIALIASVSISFITLPIIGLYFSLWRLNPLVSWLSACAIGLFVPWFIFLHGDFLLHLMQVAGFRMDLLLPMRNLPLPALTAAMVWQVMAATLAAILLHWNLSRRRFAMH